MFLRFVTVAMLAGSLLATAGSAQTAAELLQKGIYTQETAGDLDAAIQIYRQVISSAGNPRALAAQAQMRIVGVLLQKGDTAGASLEFNILVQNYADQKEIIASIAARMGAVLRASGTPAARKLMLGTLENGVYHHTATGTEIRLPVGMSITGDGPSSGGGEYAMVGDGFSQSYFVWMIPSPVPAADIPAALDHDVDYKLHQRITDGVQGFRIRPGTLIKWGSGAQQAVAVAFDFGPDEKPMVEYAAIVRTTKTEVYFRVNCLASAIANVQDRLQMLVAATTLP
jgi:hypothetical protein